MCWSACTILHKGLSNLSSRSAVRANERAYFCVLEHHARVSAVGRNHQWREALPRVAVLHIRIELQEAADLG